MESKVTRSITHNYKQKNCNCKGKQKQQQQQKMASKIETMCFGAQ